MGGPCWAHGPPTRLLHQEPTPRSFEADRPARGFSGTRASQG